MDVTLLGLLAASVALAALLFHVFVVRRERDLGGQGKAGLIAVLGILVPVLVLALWHQSQAKGRLQALGFAIAPALGASVGAAVGGGDPPTWLFALEDDGRTLLDFYRARGNRPGWTLAAETPGRLVLERDGSRMSVQVGDEHAVFVLEPAAPDRG
ncbi:MAG: hypothetical protein AB7Q81_10195 [Gammaproteobacteria bacterium]